MRVQHVWAKTGTSPVAFHNTTRDVALCPASEHRPGRVFAEIKGLKYGHIERTRATVAPPHSPDRLGHLTPWAPWPPRLLRPSSSRRAPSPSPALPPLAAWGARRPPSHRSRLRWPRRQPPIRATPSRAPPSTPRP